MSFAFAKLRRFRFNLPQRIAAALLALFLAQAFWLTAHQTLDDRDYQYARCGREMWEHSYTLDGHYTSCGNIHDGVLAYRIAGLPLTLNLRLEQLLDHFRKPEDRVVQTTDSPISSWELRHQLTHILLLMRLPFISVAVVLGGALWWVTRRLFGNLGGYTALSLYCFSPSVLHATVSPGNELLATLGIYGGLYTAIGVAHAMQGPRRKWRPRIILLTAAFGLAAAAHIAALLLVALGGLFFMLWIAENRRRQVLPVLLLATAGAFVFVFACYGFSPSAFFELFRTNSAQMGISLVNARHFFTALPNAGIAIAIAAALAFYLVNRKVRYFGNTVPLISSVVLLALVATGTQASPWLWAQPFLLTFISGVFADAYETPYRRIALASAAAIVALEAALCLFQLPGIL